jgi:hypothetical protein
MLDITFFLLWDRKFFSFSRAKLLVRRPGELSLQTTHKRAQHAETEVASFKSGPTAILTNDCVAAKKLKIASARSVFGFLFFFDKPNGPNRKARKMFVPRLRHSNVQMC